MSFKDWMSLFAWCVAPCATLGGVAAFNATEIHSTYSTDWTLDGARAVVETRTGRLGLPTVEPKIVGYYLAGAPRFVAFGCEGHDAPLIAMSRDVLPRCQRVEPVKEA